MKEEFKKANPKLFKSGKENRQMRNTAGKAWVRLNKKYLATLSSYSNNNFFSFITYSRLTNHLYLQEYFP